MNGKSGGDQGMLLPQGGQRNAQNYRLRPLIQFAYRVQPFELVGGPDWIDSARFDITAKATFEPKPASVGAPPGDMEQMVRLAERFNLQVHRETREMRIYALVLARRDGQMGPRLRREADVCAAFRNAKAGGEKPPEIPPRADGRPACGMMGRWRAFLCRGCHARDARLGVVSSSCSRGGRSHWPVRLLQLGFDWNPHALPSEYS
jgi:uncharacterized protein (TIGR03435 family)